MQANHGNATWSPAGLISQISLNEGGEAATCEIGWLADHDYNDFARVLRDQPWMQAKLGPLFPGTRTHITSFFPDLNSCILSTAPPPE